eukprot:scaffold27346_cov78-Skeletonema_dohrnii-CCMP3373.AAC.2
MDLSDLPTGTLAHVSSYLPSPSRALFAVALNHRRDSSSAIVGNQQWDVLDFGEIEKDLAAKISDDHIGGVLLCIDAVYNLKRLRLTNCINITGVGLDPLRESAIIEQIDLSLVGDHESPMLDPEPPISCVEVIPILDSIIQRGEDCSLEHLVFPKVWRKDRNTESDFHAFLSRYNDYLSSRGDICLNCSCNLPGDGHMLRMNGRYRCPYGTQNFTCYDCMDHYCDDCRVDEIWGFCGKCERSYCAQCQTVKYCHCCENDICVDCIDFKECSNCHENTCLECASGCHNNCCADKIWCNNCFDYGEYLNSCQNCRECYCYDCSESDIYALGYCYDCVDSLCGQCRVNKCKEGSYCACASWCYELSFSVLLEDKERMQNKINELENERREEQSNKIIELKREVKDLTGCRNNCCADKIWYNCRVDNRGDVRWCENENCRECYCRDCSESDIYALGYCDDCQDSLCGQCRVNKCKDEELSHCGRCEKLAFPVLLEDRERMQTKINELENERREQRNEINEDLTGGLGELAEV